MKTTKLIDTHSHLYSEKLLPDIEAVIARAKHVCEAVYLPNIEPDSIRPMLDLVARDPAFFFPMMGLHPCHVEENWEETLVEMARYFEPAAMAQTPFCGIGETGLDLYWDKTTLARQQASLAAHLEWAKEYQLPIVLHARDAIDEVIAMIARHHTPELRGIVHCFDGNAAQAQQIMEFGTFKLGIGGTVTYKTSALPEVLKAVPLEYVVLETDSPYLPPVPYRGKRNESAYVQFVAEKCCDIYGLPYAEIAALTTANARALFA